MSRKNRHRAAAAPAPAELKVAELSLAERFQWLRQAGVTFNGSRDFYEAFGYPREITPKQYREAYQRGGIAGRIVDVFPKATWRKSGDKLDGRVYEIESPDAETEFELAWVELENRLHIWETFQSADILSGLGRYSVIFIGVEGLESMEAEIPQGAPEKLLFLSPFSEHDAKVSEWDTDPRSPRFGQPNFYQLGNANFASSETIKRIHHSRVLHVAENTLDNNVFGSPRLERVWNLILDLEKITGGGAEAFWLRANQGMHLNTMPGATFSETELARLQTELDKYKHNIQRVIKTKGVDLEMLGSDVAAMQDPCDTLLTQIAGSIGIPKRMLTGSEMGQLASGQDTANWNTQVSDRRTGYAGPSIVAPFVDRLIKYGYLPTPKEYHIQWPPQQSLTETETAEYADKLAAINKHFPGRTVVQPNEVREVLGLEALPELDIDLAEEADEMGESERQQVAQLEAAMRKGALSLVVNGK